MLLTENQLRHIVRRTILIENQKKEIKNLEASLDAQDAKVEKMMAAAMSKMDKAVAKDKEEGVLQDGNVGDEALTVTAAIGLGLAIPLFLKIAGYTAKALGNSLAFIEKHAMGQTYLQGLGDDWAEWWFDWAKKAKKKKKDLMNAFAKKLLSIKYDNPNAKQIKFVSNTLWAIIYCMLGIEAGIHAWHAFQHPDFLGVLHGGFEGVMAAIKEGTAVDFLGEAIEAASGLMSAEAVGLASRSV